MAIRVPAFITTIIERSFAAGEALATIYTTTTVAFAMPAIGAALGMLILESTRAGSHGVAFAAMLALFAFGAAMEVGRGFTVARAEDAATRETVRARALQAALQVERQETARVAERLAAARAELARIASADSTRSLAGAVAASRVALASSVRVDLDSYRQAKQASRNPYCHPVLSPQRDTTRGGIH